MKLTILATSRMKQGRVCIAGINESGRWIRPDKPLHFQMEDLHDEIYKNFNVIDANLTKTPDIVLPHSEDYLVEDSAKLIRQISSQEREEFLKRHCENRFFERNGFGISKILQDAERSLVLVGPVKIKDVELGKNPRLRFEIISGVYEESIPITDLKFVTFNYKRLEERNQEFENLTGDELKNVLGIEKTYLVLGLTRLWTSNAGISDCWPMVVGFHTIPDYQGGIDYHRFSK